MNASGAYTLLLSDGSYFIDSAAADRVREALRINIERFLIFAKVCGTDEPDRLVAIDAARVLSIIAHDEISPLARHRLTRRVARRSVSRVRDSHG